MSALYHSFVHVCPISQLPSYLPCITDFFMLVLYHSFLNTCLVSQHSSYLPCITSSYTCSWQFHPGQKRVEDFFGFCNKTASKWEKNVVLVWFKWNNCRTKHVFTITCSKLHLPFDMEKILYELSQLQQVLVSFASNVCKLESYWNKTWEPLW